MQDTPEPTAEAEVRRFFDTLQSQPDQLGLSPEAARYLRIELERRKQAEQALQESEARIRAVVNAAVDGIITIDEWGTIESVNPAVERIFGYEAEELIGRNVSILMPEPYRNEHNQYIRNYLRTGQRKIIGIGREAVGQRKDGAVFPIDLAVGEARLGQRWVFTGIIRDITERKQAEEELRQAKNIAEAASQAKDQFLAVLSHELRTPLTPVLATVTFMESRLGMPPEMRDEIASIRRNIEMEARLIDDLLDLTRISRGKIQLHPEITDAHAMLRAALEICHSDIEAKDLEITISLRAKQHIVRADPARLQQVFWNLLKNAVKFTPVGGQIRLRSHNNAAGRIVIEVSDTGIGIEPNALPRIFNAFEQEEQISARRSGGLGLGLAITKALVEMHRGQLSVFSEGRDRGTTFNVELDTVADAPSPKISPPPIARAQPVKRRDQKILLVEDHEDTLRVMAELLRHLGYTVTTAATAQHALEQAKREKFDLLISDLGLPDGSGIDVIQQIGSEYAIRGIAVSGFGMDEDVRRSREAGFEYHLTKPVSFQELKTAIEQIST